MSEPDLNAMVQAAQERLSAFLERVEMPDEDLRASFQEAVADLASSVEELATAAEELQIGEEGLRQQNEELIFARADLEAERARYLDLFEFAPEAYLVTDPAGVILEANHPAASLLRVTRDRLVGKPLFLFVAERGAPDFMDRLRGIESARQAERWEMRMRGREGEPFTADIIALPVRDANDKVQAIRCSIRDVSERKRLEEELRRHKDELEVLVEERTVTLAEQERLCRTIVTTTNEGVWMCDARWRTTYVNERYAEMLGYTVEELMALPFIELVPEENRERLLQTRGLPEQGERQPYDTPMRCKDGSIRWGLACASALFDAQGNFAGSLCLITAITERKQAEEERELLAREVQAERKRLFDVLAVLPGYVCLLTPDYGFSFVNRRFVELFGEPQPGQKCHQLLFNCDTPCDGCHSYECLQTGEPLVWEWRSPADMDFEIYDYPFEDMDGTRSVLEVGFDVTERKRAADAIRHHRDHLNELVEERTAELQTANAQLAQEVGQRKQAEAQLLKYQEDQRALASGLVLGEERTRRALATGIHDEISQPLAFSRIKVGMLRQMAPTDEVRESLVEVEEVLKKVIQTSRTLTFEASPPVLYQLGLDAALQWLADDMRTRHVINAHFAAEGEPLPLGEDVKVMLFQAVRELLSNAAKHSQAENVSVLVEWLSNRVRIMVTDDGVGFTPPTESEGSQSGFGLFNIHERINHLGGALHIESCPGAGASFTIVTPAGA